MSRPPETSSSQWVSVQETLLREYLRTVRKRKWAVVGVFVSAVIGTALYVLMQPFVYESTVSLLIEPTGPKVLSKEVEEVYAPVNVAIDYYKTQYEILKSHQILKEATARLNLKAHPEYAPKPAGPLESWFYSAKNLVVSVFKSVVPSPAGQVPEEFVESEAERLLVAAFRRHVGVKPVLNSRIVRVTVDSTDPKLAADAANIIASVYITRSLEMKMRASEEASKWITGRVEELRKKVEQSERTLQEFAHRYGLVNVDERRRLGTQKLSDLNTQLVQAETKRAETEARFRQIASVLDNSEQLESSAEVLSSSLIQTLRSQEVQAAQKVAELNEKYGPKHPAMARVTSELHEVQARIKQEIKKIYSAVKGEYDVAVARERVIRNALNQQKTDVMGMGQYEVQYGILEREAQSNRQIYEMFLKRMKETDIATDIRTSNIYVADPAIVSMTPVRPKRTRTVTLAGLLGLLGGLGLAFFIEYMDNSLKTPEDLEHYLPGIAFLGYLPAFSDSRKNPGGVELATHEAGQSVFAENIRSIRTSVFLSAADRPPQSILVTSAVEDEGKSVLSVNLAIAIAQLGNPTVLIEGDLRKPRLHKVFGLEVTRGLSHYLVGDAALQDIIRTTPVPNLRVILCGAVPPNPSELLQSRHMVELLERFKKDGVHVVVDSPPVLAVSDPVIVASVVEGVVLAVWAAHSNRNAVRIAVRMLTKDGKTRLLGIVLQRLKHREMSAYYSSYYRKKYYGQEPNKVLTKRT